MKNILVTGATSFIGLHLLEYLNDKDVNIIAMVRPESSHKTKLEKFSNLNILNLGLDDVDRIGEFVENIDLCIHLAWDGTRVPERYDEEIQNKNYLASVKLFEVMEKLSCNTFLAVGSQAEYGFTQDLIKENTECNPNTAYGVYKLKTCHALLERASKSKMRFIWGRIFSIYGEGDFANTLIMSSVSKMLNNEEINMTEGKQYWNYLYVKDLVEILWILLENKQADGIYNLASNDTKMLRDYMLEMKSALNSDSKLNLGAVPYRQEGIVNIKPDISLLKEVIKEYKFTSFINGIDNIRRFYSE